MINKISNMPSYNPNFTSEVRMPYSTASTLTQYKKRVQRAIYKQIQKLENNGENNLVNISYRYEVDPNQAVGRDLLGIQILKRAGNEVILASPTVEGDICLPRVSSNGKIRHKIVNIESLYSKAKEDLLPLCNDNIFSRFI